MGNAGALVEKTEGAGIVPVEKQGRTRRRSRSIIIGLINVISTGVPQGAGGDGETCSSVVGSIMYVMVCTRPDISHAINIVSRYMDNPGKAHWQAVKLILRYLRGTTDIRIVYDRSNNIIAWSSSLISTLIFSRSIITFVKELR